MNDKQLGWIVINEDQIAPKENEWLPKKGVAANLIDAQNIIMGGKICRVECAGGQMRVLWHVNTNSIAMRALAFDIAEEAAHIWRAAPEPVVELLKTGTKRDELEDACFDAICRADELIKMYEDRSVVWLGRGASKEEVEKAVTAVKAAEHNLRYWRAARHAMYAISGAIKRNVGLAAQAAANALAAANTPKDGIVLVEKPVSRDGLAEYRVEYRGDAGREADRRAEKALALRKARAQINALLECRVNYEHAP